MKYVLLFVNTEETSQRSEAEYKDLPAKIMDWWGQHSQTGEIVNGEQLQGPETATTVRHDHGNVTIVDDRRALALARSPAERALIRSRLPG